MNPSTSRAVASRAAVKSCPGRGKCFLGDGALAIGRPVSEDPETHGPGMARCRTLAKFPRGGCAKHKKQTGWRMNVLNKKAPINPSRGSGTTNNILKTWISTNTSILVVSRNQNFEKSPRESVRSLKEHLHSCYLSIWPIIPNNSCELFPPVLRTCTCNMLLTERSIKICSAYIYIY